MTAEESPSATDRASDIANIVLLGIAVVAVGGALLVYVDRDGEGRTEDAVVAADYIQVTAVVSGEIVELAVRENQSVKKDDLIFRIDERPYAAKVEIARGAHESALAVKRDKDLTYKRVREERAARGVVSQQAVDDAEAAALKAAADVTSTAGQLALAEVELAYCTVRAGFDGIVAGLSIRIGEYVDPGQPLFALIDAETYHVVAYMKEQYLGPATPGAEAEVKLWQFPGEVFKGTVESVGRGVHAQETVNGLPVVEKTLDWVQLAARVPVRIHLETDRDLTMGGTAHVRILR